MNKEVLQKNETIDLSYKRGDGVELHLENVTVDQMAQDDYRLMRNGTPVASLFIGMSTEQYVIKLRADNPASDEEDGATATVPVSKQFVQTLLETASDMGMIHEPMDAYYME